jgi:hypothetical protein
MNHLETTISSLSYYVKDTNNAVKIIEKHYKSKSNTETTDEEIDVTTERAYSNATLVDIIYLLKQLVDEKTKLSLAIESAKKNLKLNSGLSVDSAVETAKKTRDLANVLKTLVDIKASETKKQGKAYKFNAEGNQMPYYYDINVVKTIDFDRNTVNENYKTLLATADKLSTEIEVAMLNDCVSFEPKYDIHDSVVDIVDKYVANK